jgi:hypothetical protein
MPTKETCGVKIPLEPHQLIELEEKTLTVSDNIHTYKPIPGFQNDRLHAAVVV